MLDVVILAAALYVCPGDVFSDQPREGCKPFQQTGSEGFSTVKDPPPDPGQAGQAGPNVSQPSAPSRSQEGSTNSEMCALYKEYIELEVKTQGGVFMESTEQTQRWQTLKRLFQNSPAPRCP
jgi:hypothetical protein